MRNTCQATNCELPVHGRGHCRRHYRRLERGKPIDGPFVGELSLEERFWPSVDTDGSGCWEWRRYCNEDGYGSFPVGHSHVRAHRMAWILTHGPIADGMFVCHHCDNPPCCRPDHLFLGTNADNMRDMKIKGRRLGKHAGRGEDAGRATITESDVLAIRAEYAAGVRQIDIAAHRGMERANVWAIVHRKTWTHLAPSASEMEVSA